MNTAFAIRPLASLVTALPALIVCAIGSAEPAGTEPGQLLGGKQTTYPAWFKDSFLEFEDDVAEAAAEGKRLILLFHQDNCPYCNALVERNLSQKHIEEKVRQHFDVVALNLRGDRQVVSVDGTGYTEKEFARALDIQFTPTLLFLDEEGELVLRVSGYLPPPKFEAALDFVSGKNERRGITFREYLAAAMPAGATGDLNRQAFFVPPPHDLAASPEAARPIAVFFEQRQCPACDTLHNEVLAGGETGTALEPFTAIQLDMWSDQPLVTPAGDPTTAREWANTLGIRYAPTIVLFSPTGEEIIRMEAVFKQFHTLSFFEYVSSGAWRREPDFQRFLTERANTIRATGQDVDIGN